jgi:hypothetical protein
MDAFDSTANTRFTRCNLLFVTADAAAIGGSGGAAAQSPAAPPAARIELVTVKGRGVGLRGHDPDRAFAGFTLFSPLPSNNKMVYLIDMQGKRRPHLADALPTRPVGLPDRSRANLDAGGQPNPRLRQSARLRRLRSIEHRPHRRNGDRDADEQDNPEADERRHADHPT